MNGTTIGIVAGVLIVGGWTGLLWFVLFYLPKWKRQRELTRKGRGMAKLRESWTLEYGVGPDPESWKGFKKTVTVRLIAESHDAAVALLREYDPDFDPLYIVESKRGGLAYVVSERNA